MYHFQSCDSFREEEERVLDKLWILFVCVFGDIKTVLYKMPLYPRRSKVAVTFYGASATPITAGDSRNSDLRRFHVIPAYPSPHRRREITSAASSSSFRTSYIMADDSSDSDSDDSTISDVSRQFWQKRALAKGNFRVDDSSDSDSMKSETVTNQTYSTIHVPPSSSRQQKDAYRFNVEGTGPILSICKYRGGYCWISRHNDKVIYLYQRTGVKKDWRTISSRLGHIAFRDDKVILVVPELSQTIFKMASSGRLTPFMSFELEIGGICTTSRYETLVTTTPLQKSHKKGPRPIHIPSILRISREGEVIWSIRHKGTDAFVRPTKITVNSNGDICVLDLEPTREHLVILSPDGEERKRYFGVQDKVLAHPFEPKDVCCDGKGHIYVADLQNCAVHVLDKHGNFQHFLFTKDDPYPYPVALTCESGKFIWVGLITGAVRVFDIKQIETLRVQPKPQPVSTSRLSKNAIQLNKKATTR